MKKIEIKSQKQDNGIWGMPLNCVKMNNFKLYNDYLVLLSSALIIAIDEKFNRKFEIWYEDDYLSVIIQSESISDYSFNLGKRYTVYFKNYSVIDNTLFEFDNEKEKKIFLRKQKINKLQLC